MKVLLSIKPEFVEEIFSGKKRYEYRKRVFKREIESVVIYASKPVGKIVGEFTIKSILEESPQGIWDKTQKFSGVSKEFFFEYFGDRDEAYAIEIDKIRIYQEPIDPYQGSEKFVAPQSYKYLSEVETEYREKLCYG